MAKKKEAESGQDTERGQDTESRIKPDPGRDLIDEACEAYGIAKQYVFASAYYPLSNEAVILTAGGTKVRYRKGDQVQKLDPIQVDGIIRKKMRQITGSKKK